LARSLLKMCLGVSRLKQAKLFIMERRATELELLLERKRAVQDAIRALEQYRLLKKVRIKSGTGRPMN